MIGTSLAARLVARGDQVVVLTRSPKEGHHIRWDESKGIGEPKRLEGLDSFINLVGAPIAARPWTRRRREVLRRSRVEATELLLDALSQLDQPPRSVVGVSGLGLFGDRGDELLDEQTPPGTGFLAELCIAWEAAQFSAVEVLGARTAVLRMSVVLSPTGGLFPLMVRPFRYVGGWLGDGHQYTSWISIRDCVNALIHLIDQELCAGPFNGTVPEPIRNRAWCEALGRALHRPVLGHAPTWALRGALGDLSEQLFLASVRAVPTKLTASGYQFVDTDAETTFQWLLAELKRQPQRPRRRRGSPLR
jgi:uncharacterized protein